MAIIKRKALIIVVTSAIAATLLLMSALSPFASGSGYPWDLNNFVTEVTVRDILGAVVTGGAFVYGDSYTFSIHFNESVENGQFAYTNIDGKDVLLYQLPDALTIPYSSESGDVYVEKGVAVGGYAIDSSGLVKVWFGNFDKDGKPAPGNFIDYTDAGFTLEIKAAFSGDAEVGDVTFGTGAIITITSLNQPDLGVNVEKFSEYSAIDEIISYTVVITASGAPTDNPIKNVTLTDIPFYRSDGASAKSSIPNDTRPAYKTISYNMNGGAEIPIAVVWSDFLDIENRNRFTYTFPDVLILGDVITVTYTLDLYEFFRLDTTDMSATKLQYDRLIGNDVIAMTEGGKSGTASVQDRVRKTFVSKGVTALGGLPATAVRWIAAVGDGTRQLNREVLVDTISATIAGFPDLSDIKIRMYGKPSGAEIDTFPVGQFVAATDKIGDFIAYDLAVILIGNDLILSVPDIGDKNPLGGYFPEIYRVEIEFETAIAQSGDLPYNTSAVYENTIIYDETSADARYTVFGPVPVVPAKPIIKKSSSQINKDASGSYFISYTAEFTVPEGNEAYPYLGENVFYYDELIINSGGTILNEPRNITVTAKNGDAPLHELKAGAGAEDYNLATDSQYFYIYFGGTVPSVWPYDTETTIIITYDIPLDTKTIDGDEIGALLQEASERYLRNRAYVYNPIGKIPVGPSTVYNAWPINKTATINANDESVFNYKVVLNGSTYAITSLFESGAAVLFSDAFDEGLEYIPGSLYVIAKPDASISAGWSYYTPSAGSASVDDPTSISGVNAITADFSTMYRIASWGGSVALSSGFNQPANTSSAHVDYQYWYTKECIFEVCYQLRVSDRNNTENGSIFGNSATINTALCDFSSSCDVTYTKDNPLKKYMTENGSNLVEVEIIINPNGRKLLDKPAMGALLTAVDKMSPNLSFYLSSIKYYTKVESGGVWTDEWVEQPGSLSGVWRVKTINAHEAEFILPDETPIKITYSALVTRPVGELVTVENTISVEGYASAEASKTFIITQTDAFASANKTELHVFKTDAEVENSRLDGAGFKLYMALQSGAPYDVSGWSDMIKIGAWNFYDVMAAKPGSGIGEYIFDSVWITPSHKAVYLIVETNAPDGFILPDSPENYTFFVIHSMGEGDMAALESALSAPVFYTADTIFIENTKAPKPPEPPETVDPEDPEQPPEQDAPPEAELPPETEPPPEAEPPAHTTFGSDTNELPETELPSGTIDPDDETPQETVDDPLVIEEPDENEAENPEEPEPLGILPQTGNLEALSIFFAILSFTLMGTGLIHCLKYSRKDKSDK